MPVSPEKEKALPQFINTLTSKKSLQDDFNAIDDINSLRDLVQSIDPTLTGSALIPLEQATRPPKIHVDSGSLDRQIPWRLLRCTGGPLVLQMICAKANFAIWIEPC